MDRVNRILHNPRYRECVEKNRKYEEERIFCRHDMSHFLDVARLSWIENLEKGLGIEKELIYAAALLHDCGRRGVLYRADKKSRSCFACPAEGACSWPPSKKNLLLKW